MHETFATTLAAVLFGNAVTAMFFYGLWRLRKKENDGPAIILILFCSFVAIAAGFALRELSQEQTPAQTHSAR